jgi:hypothetical protein
LCYTIVEGKREKKGPPDMTLIAILAAAVLAGGIATSHVATSSTVARLGRYAVAIGLVVLVSIIVSGIA